MAEMRAMNDCESLSQGMMNLNLALSMYCWRVRKCWCFILTPAGASRGGGWRTDAEGEQYRRFLYTVPSFIAVLAIGRRPSHHQIHYALWAMEILQENQSKIHYRRNAWHKWRRGQHPALSKSIVEKNFKTDDSVEATTEGNADQLCCLRNGNIAWTIVVWEESIWPYLVGNGKKRPHWALSKSITNKWVMKKAVTTDKNTAINRHLPYWSRRLAHFRPVRRSSS